MSEDSLSRYFVDLRSRSDEVRAQAASDLRFTVDRFAREMPVESFSRLLGDINRRLQELVNSGDVNEKLGAVLLIRELLPVADHEDREARLIRFVNFLRMIFQQSGMSEAEQKLIRETAVTLGELAVQGGVLAADTVEFEVKRALEWLEGERSEQRRFCAVCVLKSLAQRTPTLFNVHVGQFLDRVWLTLRDPKIVIREVSAEALRECLQLVAKRSLKLKQPRYAVLYETVLASVRNGGFENSHAALLVLSELLRNSEYMQARFKECCDLVLRFREHRERFIRDSVVSIIPQLAACSPAMFVRTYARETLTYLLSSLRANATSREITFIAIGDFALAVKEAIVPDLESILQVIKEGLTIRSKKTFCVEALTCLASICRALGNRNARLNSGMKELIECMFAAGLSAQLIDALCIICQAMPAFLPAVQERILAALATILADGQQTAGGKDKSESGRRSLSLSSFSFGTSFSFPLFSPASSIDLKNTDLASTDLLMLALTTLGTFDFKDHNLLPFVRDAVLPFLNDERARVRRRAALSTASIVLQSEQRWQHILERDQQQHRAHELELSQSKKSSEADRETRGSLIAVRDKLLVSKTVASIEQQQQKPLPALTASVTAPVENKSALTRVASQPSLSLLALPSKPSAKAASANSSPQSSHKQLIPAPSSSSSPAWSSPSHAAQSLAHLALIVDVIERLLTLAVSDPDPTIRKSVIDALLADASLDHCFCDGKLIDTLFLALHDEIFANREGALRLIGRLALQLPPYVMPSMRKTVAQLLSQLEYTGDVRQKEESALLLGALVRSSRHLMRPYAAPILASLTARLQSAQVPGVVAACVASLGDLAEISDEELSESLYELTPLVVAIIEDKASSVSKEVALRCLSSLISSTGRVCEPWHRFPHLLPSLLALLKSGVHWPIRREILKLFGVLGAIDPLQYKEIMLTAGIESRGDDDLLRMNSNESPPPPPHELMQNEGAGGGAVDELQPSALPSTIHFTPSHDELFPRLSLQAIIGILREPALSLHHAKAVQALSIILKNLSMARLLSFLPLVVPLLLLVIRTRVSAGNDDLVVDSLFAQLQMLVAVCRHHLKAYVPSLTRLALDMLTDAPHKHELTFALIERLSAAMRDEWRVYLPSLLPPLLSLLHTDRTPHRVATVRVLRAFDAFGHSVVDYLHLIVPSIVRLAEQPDTGIALRVMALRTLGSMSRTMDLSDFAGRIVHPIARLLELAESNSKVAATPRNPVPPLVTASARDDVLLCLCLLVFQLDSAYLMFIPMLNKILLKQNIHFAVYDALVSKILARQPLSIADIAPLRPMFPRISAQSLTVSELGADKENSLSIINSGTVASPATGTTSLSSSSSSSSLSSASSTYNHAHSHLVNISEEESGVDLELASLSLDSSHAATKRLSMNAPLLKKSWEVSQRSTSDDWQDWFRGFSVELLKESPAPSLRACSLLASKYHLLARDLFQAAFVSCWLELSDELKDDLIRCFDIALNSPSIPPEIVQLILNLAEFTERDGRPLPMSVAKLGAMAQNVHAYAKALYYKEQEFLISPQAALDGLIGLHNELDQPEAAIGSLALAKSRSLAIQIKESWLEKLQRWDDALEAYEHKALQLELESGDALSPSAAASNGGGGSAEESRESAHLEVVMGRIRCLRALGEWERLDQLASRSYRRAALDDSNRYELAPLAAQGAWMCGRWSEMGEFMAGMEEGRFETEFYRAVLAVHYDHGEALRASLERAREILDAELAALVGESYDRAYRVLVQCQQLTELEEVHRLHTSEQEGHHGSRLRLYQTWLRRLAGCALNVDVWSSILAVRALTQAPEHDLATQIKFASLCRKSNRMAAALKVFARLMPQEFAEQRHPAVAFAYLKHQWHASGFEKELKEAAYMQMIHFVSSLNSQRVPNRRDNDLALHDVLSTTVSLGTSTADPQLSAWSRSSSAMSPVLLLEARHRDHDHGAFLQAWSNGGHKNSSSSPSLASQELNQLRARAYLKLGEWQLALDGDTLNDDNVITVLNAFHAATVCSPRSYETWHQFAVMNFRCVTHFQMQRQRALSDEKAQSELSPTLSARLDELDARIFAHVIPAVKGFFHSIALAGSRGLQDILRLLTLWFAHGTAPEIESALNEGFNSVSIDTWLPVIPQIIARIDSCHSIIRRMIQSLLCQIGRAHPQALVYPLAVVLKSGSPGGGSAAASHASVVMADMCNHSLSLVEEALLVSKELIRVAILWHELWHEALEEASRVWFGAHNVDAMIATLQPLHNMIARGPSTLREIGFLHAFGRDLSEAHEWTQRFQRTGFESDVSAAWDLYCVVFRRINRQMSSMNELELQYVSPRLLHARDLQIAMPGTYLADRDAPDKRHVTIHHFARTMRVIESKQRPRKLAIIGNDGGEYAFLLKGHEDLRQDKRVMQLFGLINGFLSASSAAQAHNSEQLSIKGYSVIPLSQESGLIQWLHNCDTMHALIKEYRETSKILLNIEHRLMIGMVFKAEDFTLLSLIHKVEVFEHALSKTSGTDLARVLWLHSSNSETWLERRGCFTRSLAVMSMVGYVLGLGDRHPCNLMISQQTGKVIHVDFGDCFEVAQTREKFPEKIPFRLTRMLVSAMELSGIEGTFRTVCETVIRVLRANKESVMAVLEAFVHDPLLGWRLLKNEPVVDATTVNDQQVESNANGFAEDSAEIAFEEDDALAAPHQLNDSLVLEQEDQEGERPMPRLAPAALFSFVNDDNFDAMNSELNAKALTVIARVESKLIGRDFNPAQTLDVEAQVERLIKEATSSINLCALYMGWSAFF